jgi:hypothetical protein
MNLIDIYVKSENMKDFMDNLTRCSLCCAFLNCHVIRVMSKNIIGVIGDKKNSQYEGAQPNPITFMAF